MMGYLWKTTSARTVKSPISPLQHLNARERQPNGNYHPSGVDLILLGRLTSSKKSRYPRLSLRKCLLFAQRPSLFFPRPMLSGFFYPAQFIAIRWGTVYGDFWIGYATSICRQRLPTELPKNSLLFCSGRTLFNLPPARHRRPKTGQKGHVLIGMDTFERYVFFHSVQNRLICPYAPTFLAIDFFLFRITIDLNT